LVGPALILGAAVTGEWGSLRRAAIAGVIGFGVFYLLWKLVRAASASVTSGLSGLLSLALGWLGWGQLVTGLYGGFFPRRGDRHRADGWRKAINANSCSRSAPTCSSAHWPVC